MTMKNDPFGMVRNATKQAFEQVRRVSNVESDPDLRMYQSLKPEHFQALMRQFGEPAIIQYIQDMEGRRIMRRGG